MTVQGEGPDPRDPRAESRPGEPSAPAGSSAPTRENAGPGAPPDTHAYAHGTAVSHYQIRDPLGRGGMGEVYAGYDLTLRRSVALKAIRAERRLHPAARARFRREARVLSRLDHPHICRIFDYVEGEQSDFIVLELIEGEVLGAAIRRGLDRARKLQIAEQLAQVLAAAHAVGVVHRDLKPGNVMLTSGGSIKVLDFGLASHLEGAAGEVEDEVDGDEPAEPSPGPAHGSGEEAETRSRYGTRAGDLMGTLPYMSPEQARAQPAQPASDMFAFGLLLQELFTGRPAYRRDVGEAELLKMVRSGETSPPEGVSADLADLIRRLTAVAPTHRPTAVEAAERLRRIRERPRRIVRRFVAAAVLAAVALAGAKYTVDLRRERSIADQRRKQAENLVEYMLGDLRAKLEPIGRLDILDDVGDEAIGYFAAVPVERLSDEELLSRSKALHQIGEVRLLQDDADLSAALSAFQESLELSRSLVAADPEAADRRFRLSQSEFWVGYVHWQRNQLEEALAHFHAYLEIAEWLVAREPGNPEWRLELSYAHSNIGSVLEARGELDAALEKYQETLAINQALVEMVPANLEWKEQLAEQHNLVGSVRMQLGDLAGALDSFLADLELKKELVAAEPANSTWLNGLANSHNWIAQVLVARGSPDEALPHLEEDLRLTRRLAEQDETNTRHQFNLGRTWKSLAHLNVALGRHDRAVADARASLAIFTRLEEQDPTHARWRLNRTSSQLTLAQAFLAGGERAAGERALEAAVARLHLPPDGEAVGDELIVICETLSLLAEEAAPDLRRLIPPGTWSATLDVLAAAAGTSRDVRLLDPWVRLLHLAGRGEEAGPIRDRLAGIGYRNPEYLEFMRRRGFM